MRNQRTLGGGIYSYALENAVARIDGCLFGNNFAGAKHLNIGELFSSLV